MKVIRSICLEIIFESWNAEMVEPKFKSVWYEEYRHITSECIVDLWVGNDRKRVRNGG